MVIYGISSYILKMIQILWNTTEMESIYSCLEEVSALKKPLARSLRLGLERAQKKYNIRVGKFLGKCSRWPFLLMVVSRLEHKEFIAFLVLKNATVCIICGTLAKAQTCETVWPDEAGLSTMETTILIFTHLQVQNQSACFVWQVPSGAVSSTKSNLIRKALSQFSQHSVFTLAGTILFSQFSLTALHTVSSLGL